VSVGGGSVIDGTKAVAVRVNYPTPDRRPHHALRAEMGARDRVTDEEAGRKSGFADPKPSRRW
jgi:alcohol dehydrogenase YqhD (iron-dependent ADH family)